MVTSDRNIVICKHVVPRHVPRDAYSDDSYCQFELKDTKLPSWTNELSQATRYTQKEADMILVLLDTAYPKSIDLNNDLFYLSLENIP